MQLFMALVAVVFVFLAGGRSISVSTAEAAALKPTALVLVNSQSPNYLDFEHFIQPYLDHFGIPYTMLDISSEPVTADVNVYALIIIGHRNLDSGVTPHLTHLTLDMENLISAAIHDGGSGLINFDNSRTGKPLV